MLVEPDSTKVKIEYFENFSKTFESFSKSHFYFSFQFHFSFFVDSTPCFST